MVRPLRIEFEGAVYHVIARGNRRESIYLDGEDFARFIMLLGGVCSRCHWVVHAYCLMTHHDPVLVETPDANLCAGGQQLNNVYSQSFNRRHRRVGHLLGAQSPTGQLRRCFYQTLCVMAAEELSLQEKTEEATSENRRTS